MTTQTPNTIRRSQVQNQRPQPTSDKPLDVSNEPKLPMLVEKMAAAVDMLPNQYFNTVKITCGLKDANYAQTMAFLLTAKKYGLDPMVRQVYAFAKDGKVVPIVPIDGWLKIINEHPQFDGIEFIDEFDEKDKIFSITCKIHRKDRKYPVILTEYLSECKRDTGPWKWEIRMLRHKATIQTARYAFGLSGIFDEDEAGRIQESHLQTEEQVEANVAAHMQEIGEDQSSSSHYQEGEFVDEETGEVTNIPNQAPAEPPNDWEAIYDELAPGVSAAKNTIDLKVFFEENEKQINLMSAHAPKSVIDKWVKLCTDRQAAFQKK